MRFTGASDDDWVKEKRIVCGRKRGWQFEGEGARGVPARPLRTGWARRPSLHRLTTSTDVGGRMRPPLREHGYRLAGTFPASAADGIVVTRPCVPVACAGTAVAAGAAAAAGIIPSALRTSASSLAIVSLFSFRKLRAFSRPCPMRSPL